MILFDFTQSYDFIQSYIRFYHFYDPTTILNVLARWGHKIVQFFDPDRDFDNYANVSNSYFLIAVPNCLYYKDLTRNFQQTKNTKFFLG